MSDSPEVVVTIRQKSVELSYTAGSIDEAVAIQTDHKGSLQKFFAVDIGDNGGSAVADSSAAPAKPAKAPRKNSKNQADPASANAPPPIPIPGANAPPPIPPTPAHLQVPADGSIPQFLDRSASAAPPPPPMPNAPPVVPPVPTNPLAGKVVEAIKARSVADGGAGMLAWLVQSEAVVSGAKFDEACECIAFLAPAKLTQIAGALGVS